MLIMLQQLPKQTGHLSVKGLEVLPELSDAIAFADFNAEALLICHIGGQATEALTPAASNPHQQGIAPRLHEDSVNVANV